MRTTPRVVPVMLVTLIFAGRPCPAGPEAGSAVKAQLDVPPKDRQKPYSPADGQTVPVTPPPFIWVPAGRDATYTLQVSRSGRFDEATTRIFRGIKTSVFVLGEPLPPGKWFWRYGVRTATGEIFGRPRPFTVPRGARPFAFPDFEKVIARVPEGRPRLLFAGKDLAAIRRAARNELEADVAGLLARCRKAIGAELVAEPPRPKSGPECVHVMRTTRPPMDDMERCALAYLLTGDEPLGLESKRRILHFFSWDPKGPTGLWGYDEPAMWMMMRGIRAYDWTYGLFTPAERARVEPVMKERARQFYVHLKEKRRFETDPYESHAGRMPGFLGEAALCFAHEWPEARTWLEYATLLYYTSYPAWGGDDGGWQEGPGYWSAYMNFALHYVAALRNATGVDLMNKPFFRNTPYYALYTATPYHEHRPFGDGAIGGPGSLGPVLYAFSTLLQDPYLRWYQRESGRPVGRDLLTLATYDPTLKPREPKDLPPGRVFPSVGLAAIHTALGDRDNDVTFLLRSSPFGSVSHGHADQNAFVIEAFGRGLALATGYYPWYGSPHHYQWTRATRSVNSVLVDGEGQVVRSWQATGEITAFEIGSGYDYIEGEAGRAYSDRLERFRRHVVHVRPGTFILFDDLVAPKAATFQWLLHAHDRIGVEGRVLTVRREPAAMKVHMLLPRQLDISQTDKYDPEPEDEKVKGIKWQKTWHLTASTMEPAAAGQFLAVLMVHRGSAAVDLPEVKRLEGRGAVGVKLTRPDGATDTVVFRADADAKRVTCGGLTSDARVFAEGTDKAGRTVRTFRHPAGPKGQQGGRPMGSGSAAVAVVR